MDFSAVRHKPVIGYLLALPFRLIPKTAQVRIIQGPLRGKRWIVGSGMHGWWLGSYEHEKQLRLQAAVRPGHVFYDVGANVGFYSLLGSVLTGASGKVYSFEPVESNLCFLREHLNLNHVSNCTILQAAVSSSDGYAEFEAGPSPQMGRLAHAKDNTMTVRTIAIDSLVARAELPPPDVIKCDIEGGEYDALIGARQTLERFHPTVFLATHGPEVHEACCRELLDLKYRLTPLDHGSLGMARELVATAS